MNKLGHNSYYTEVYQFLDTANREQLIDFGLRLEKYINVRLLMDPVQSRPFTFRDRNNLEVFNYLYITNNGLRIKTRKKLMRKSYYIRNQSKEVCAMIGSHWGYEFMYNIIKYE